MLDMGLHRRALLRTVTCPLFALAHPRSGPTGYLHARAVCASVSNIPSYTALVDCHQIVVAVIAGIAFGSIIGTW